MIYDGHAYCFPDLRGSGGFADRAEFQRHVQLAVAGMGHSREPWRKRDRAPADTSALADMSRGWSFDALEDIALTADRGRFEWTVGGDTYVKQLMPPSIADMDYDADSLIAEMDYAGVDIAMLHRTAYLGIGNDFVANCVRQYPDRLQGLAFIEPWLVQPEPAACIAKLDEAINRQGLSALQFMPMFLSAYEQYEDWDAPGFKPFWDAVAEMAIPVFFTLAPRSATVDSYIDELKVLRRWMEAYPDVVVIFTHGFSWRTFREGDTMNLPDALFREVPSESPNFYMQLVLSVTLGARWPYPMPQFEPAMEKLVERIGADKLMWGSDHPFEMLHYTYRQCLDQIRGYDNVLSAGDIAAITGGNMARVMGLPDERKGLS